MNEDIRKNEIPEDALEKVSGGVNLSQMVIAESEREEKESETSKLLADLVARSEG